MSEARTLVPISFEWRGEVTNPEMNALHAEAFETRVYQDTMVASAGRHRGIGTKLVALAVEEARRAGCEWMHVDFEDHLRAFYFDACGFTPTNEGLIEL